MNIEHLRAILWLRWRMTANQWRRAGVFNAIVTTALVVMALVSSFVLFFVALIGGSIFLIHQQPEPDVLMLTWDVIVLVFLFVWLIGLVTELQRSELLSLDRLLHLPLSLSGAFCLNYSSSLLSLPILVFVPGMLGLAIACIIAHGLPMLPVLPLLASFLLFLTAITYQFRGWLATLMENKRRRKSIIVGITIGIIVLFQAPQLVNVAFMQSNSRRNSDHSQEYRQAVEELNRRLVAGEIDVADNARQMRALEEQRKDRRAETNARRYSSFVGYVLLGNKIVPFGWLPYGVRAAAMGNGVPGALLAFVMFGAGSLSLWRAYRTTLRFYTGTRSATKKTVSASRIETKPKDSNGLETRIPFLSEHVSTIAVMGFRSMLRAPEAKMALLSPVILVLIFGGMILLGPGQMLRERNIEAVPSFVGLGIIGVMQIGLAQLMINIFGMDRGGFRAFVLMPVRRRDVLVGKNLSILPIAFCTAIVLIFLLQIVWGMRASHLLATLVQLVPSYLIFCLAGNTSSILAPMAIASGSLKPTQPSLWPVLLQMLFMLCGPIALLPAVALLSAETTLTLTTGLKGLPIYLVFSVLEAGLMIWIYRTVVESQGRWLQKREPRISELLSKVPE